MNDEWDDGNVTMDTPVVIPPKWTFNSNHANADDLWNSNGSNFAYDPRPERENKSRIFTNSGGRGSGGWGGNRGRGGRENPGRSQYNSSAATESFGRGGNRGRGGGSSNQGRNHYNSNEISETINVPTRFVGKVIGMYIHIRNISKYFW